MRFSARPASAPIRIFFFGKRRPLGPPARDAEVSVLYASLARDGALAEVASYVMMLTPAPLSRPLKVSTLRASTSGTLRLGHSDLETVGVDMTRYGERDYIFTQSIGAALAFLGLDGLIAPSARWPCDNLMIFRTTHRVPVERLEVVGAEEVDWGAWARSNGLLPP